MIGYIFTDNRTIKDNIKYEIGKRYKIETEENFIFYERSINDFKDILICDKIYKIKVYDSSDNDGTRNYKILCEINYKNLLNSENKNEQIMSAIKNKEESILKKLSELPTNFRLQVVHIARINRKKDLDYFLKNISKFDKHYKNELLTQIAHFGNDDHLDTHKLIESNNYCVYYELFNHGRIKDLNEMKQHHQVSYLFDFDSVQFPW